MFATNGSYYKASGKFSPSSIFFFIISVVIAIPIISTAYIYLNYYVPYIYPDILFAIGGGVLLGLVIAYVPVKLGKIRSLALAVFMAFIAACVMKYVQWCVYIPLIYEPDASITQRFLDSILLFRSPGAIVSCAQEINQYGVWSIGSGGDAVTGVMLYAVWIIEFLIILVSTCLAACYTPRDTFSEAANKWYKKMAFNFRRSILEGRESIKASMENGDFVSLIAAVKANNSDPASYLSFKFEESPDTMSDEPIYMTVESVTITRDRRNKAKAQKTNWISKMAIDRKIFGDIKNAVENPEPAAMPIAAE